ncbi:MAG TPA: hypothetical protein DCQ29_05060, partial [Chitinophagaceae bacterium]|nr:hypothetical protein [Chitinophagaceae bacterium]
MYTNKEFSAVAEASIRVAALITSDPALYQLDKMGGGFLIHYSSNVAEYEYYLAEQSINTLPEVLLIEADPYGK